MNVIQTFSSCKLCKKKKKKKSSSESIPWVLIITSPRVLICDGGVVVCVWGGCAQVGESEAVEETHLPLLPALPEECFSSVPSAPCVDALSAGCVLHVKQAADAVRRNKGPRGTRGKQNTGKAPPPCHPPGLTFFLLPLLGSTSHYFSPVSSFKNYGWRTTEAVVHSNKDVLKLQC